MIKSTPFVKIHQSLGAKMVDFAGFLMPLEYSGILNEHLAVRQRVAVFDVSHMGEIWVKGPNALDFVQKVCSNDASVLKPGQVQYSCFPNGKGGIVDDLLVYAFDTQNFLLVVNASNTDKDFQWLADNNTQDALLENASPNIAQLAVQGPNALQTVQKLTSVHLSDLPYYHFTKGKIAGIENVIISATGYTGAGGFELYFENQFAEKMWKALFEAGSEYGIIPAGLGARDTLRLEMGYCLYGNDIDETTSPIEAGLAWITKFTENKQFIDRDRLLAQKTNGVQRKLRGFVMLDKGIPRHGYELVDAHDKVIGQVTSGSISPILNKGIGLAYLDTKESQFDNVIYVRIRNRNLKAQIVKLPFI